MLLQWIKKLHEQVLLAICDCLDQKLVIWRKEEERATFTRSFAWLEDTVTVLLHRQGGIDVILSDAVEVSKNFEFFVVNRGELRLDFDLSVLGRWAFVWVIKSRFWYDITKIVETSHILFISLVYTHDWHPLFRVKWDVPQLWVLRHVIVLDFDLFFAYWLYNSDQNHTDIFCVHRRSDERVQRLVWKLGLLWKFPLFSETAEDGLHYFCEFCPDVGVRDPGDSATDAD